MKILQNLNAASRRVAETLFARFPQTVEFAKVYVPVNDLDRESDAGSLYVDFPVMAKSGLERITIHHRGDCFEIGCYYDGAKFPEEFQIISSSNNNNFDELAITDFIEELLNLPPNSL